MSVIVNSDSLLDVYHENSLDTLTPSSYNALIKNHKKWTLSDVPALGADEQEVATPILSHGIF